MSLLADFSLSVIVDDPGWDACLGEAASLVQQVLAHAGTAEKALGGVAVLLSNDAALHRLNLQFRGQDKPTNVLAFPAPAGQDYALGDIAIALGVAQHEAAAQGKTLAAHLAHLALHGFLHLLGYDHENDADAGVMEARETALLAELGYEAPY